MRTEDLLRYMTALQPKRKLARASGIPVERLAGDAVKPESIPAAKSPAMSQESDEESE